jgi:aspartyl-tRNA(Asn)/glutamyl-tRNA(Gln) amidotransferase subunit A
MTILEAAARLSARKISSRELTQAALASISRLNPKLNAFLTVMEQSALARAQKMDEELAAGGNRGPLHGIPVAVKDVFCTKGVKTTCGSKPLANHVPGYDAAVVERLDGAGAIIIGKTAMHEFAYGITSNNPHYGAVRNPWNTDCIPGGSSGGSGSAVSAEMVFMAMGSDTGGSIRIPAAFCGTTGIKPTTGRVSRYGVMPLDFTLDHMGPLTRSVRDAALCLQAIAGYDPRDDSSSREPISDYLPGLQVSIKGLRIGIPENFYYDRLHPDVERGVRSMAAAAQQLGAVLVPVKVPDIASINAVGRVILLAEATATMTPFLSRRSDIGSDVLTLLDQGRLIPAADYVNAQRLRRLYQREFASLWSQADCLLVPTTPNTAPRIGQSEVDLGGVKEDARLASTRLVRGINVLGLPALSQPCGLAQDGLPVSTQIIGRPFDEATVFRLGAALEDATAHHTRRPPVL